MIRFMLFIDGTWLYSNTSRLVEASGEPGFALDFGKLPRVLADEVARAMGHDEYTVVRTHLFGSYADNVDPRDVEPVQRRLGFFGLLRQQHHYEVEAFPINFRGKRLRKTDRDPDDTFEPKEKCVDIALATAMLFNAAMPNAYDVAIAVLGDQDFKPVLQSVRRLGKRVAIASVQGACAGELSDPVDAARLRDLDVMWLEDLLPRLARRYDPHVLECQSPIHVGDRQVTTTYYPRRGEKFYCETCRESFARARHDGGDGAAEARAVRWAPVGTPLRGAVSHKRPDKSYGFIRVEGCGDWDGPEYFFHDSDICDGTSFAELGEGEIVLFEVKAEPPAGKAPPARAVRRVDAA
ncbi:MAG TPA: NYN domain-containing protein [Candidatus Acidoferrales bacterium]|nr:NYN domain-containing protein [Candidatus Acidoferrales bacterium]